VFHLYVLRCDRRQALLDHLEAVGILAGVHYPVPVHRQAAYRGRIRTAEDMGVTEALATEVISLPMYPELDDGQFRQVVRAIFQWADQR
jgi:dTDP-4-amino-4,6-dideoxygalactose transaminase